MISQENFIKKCEKELLLKRDLSEETFRLIHDLSDRNKVLCKPILDFIGRMRKPIDIEVKKKKFDFSPKERISICRLIPLTMSLDTNNPAWSSYMLTQAVKAAISINEIKLSEIGIAILEIFSEFKTPLNRFVYNFCIDLSREFTVHFRSRLNELDVLNSWENSCSKSLASVEFLKSILGGSDKPEFVLKTMIALLQNEYLEEFVGTTKYLFESPEYKETFLERLSNKSLSATDKSLILSAINS